jgi:signal transduction histidine kinase
MDSIPLRLKRAIDAGGEAAARVRSHDWEHNELGRISDWPSSLIAAVSTCLSTGFPMVVNWGRRLIQIYNDAALPVYGQKHPDAMGQPARTNFPELWDVSPLQPLVEDIFETARPFCAADQRLPVYRNGVLEEAYFTFSISPILDDDGTVLGILNTYVETTARVLGERRISTLRRLAERAIHARRPSDACTEAAAALATNPYDLRFVLLYLADGTAMSLAGSTVLAADSPARQFAWPFEKVVESRKAVLVEDLPSLVDLGAWPHRTTKPKDALLLPLARSADAPLTGVLVVGLSPRGRLDDAYRGFLELVAAQIATGIGSAEAYEEARERARRLAEIDRAKDAFYSNVSHELRTPLTLLLAPVEDMLREEEGPLNAPQRNALLSLRRNALRLRRLVNGLLDLANLEAGRLTMEAEPTDLAELTREVASTAQPSIAAAGIRFVVDCPPLPRKVGIDRNAWETIVFNLLTNALNYTRQGTIAIRLAPIDGSARLVVSDTGVGIPPTVLPHVFDRFYRSPEPAARSVEGTGIGLSLVREFAHALGGEVTATSTPHRGSTFTVEVPLKRPSATPRNGAHTTRPLAVVPPPTTAPALTAPAAQDGNRQRVLVVEDNPDMSQYLVHILGHDYDVEAVADGDAALSALPSFHPDLVVSDVLMPGVDGLALVRALRAAPDTRAMPAILITARTGEDAVLEGLGSGADDFIVKPFHSRELRARVQTHLELARMRRDIGEAEMKDTFIAMISHELRTPLTSIKLQLALLAELAVKRAPVSEARIGNVRRAIARMESLVDDLLSYSAIKAGSLPLRRERADLASLCQLAAEEQRLISRRDVTVAAPAEPIFAMVDPRLIQQVLGNLISNALKYSSSERPVAVRLRTENGTAIISVHDQGPGIPAEALPHVFDHFYRAPSVEVRSGSRTGLGLGLAISRAIVTRHGGFIDVESEIGRGSTFLVHLPLSAPSISVMLNA